MDQETVDEIKRHCGIIAGQLRGDVRGVAEGQHQLHVGLAQLRSDLGRESEETRALIRLSYGELDRRLRGLETEVADLRARLERVEARQTH